MKRPLPTGKTYERDPDTFFYPKRLWWSFFWSIRVAYASTRGCIAAAQQQRGDFGGDLVETVG